MEEEIRKIEKHGLNDLEGGNYSEESSFEEPFQDSSSDASLPSTSDTESEHQLSDSVDEASMNVEGRDDGNNESTTKFKKPIDRIALEKDGTVIDDEEILIMLKDETLIALSKNEKWLTIEESNSINTLPSEPRNPIPSIHYQVNQHP
ncbi:CIDE-N domain [Popillia japonica]|uniref:CIDE-N domain n=1 Tax=Popillia japonica TaxID=7064 RepID=A0AAW1MZH8_POPJA